VLGAHACGIGPEGVIVNNTLYPIKFLTFSSFNGFVGIKEHGYSTIKTALPFLSNMYLGCCPPLVTEQQYLFV